jgi:hypothetical protein
MHHTHDWWGVPPGVGSLASRVQSPEMAALGREWFSTFGPGLPILTKQQTDFSTKADRPHF